MLGKGLQEPPLEDNRKFKMVMNCVKFDPLIKTNLFRFPGGLQTLHYAA